MQIIPLSPVPNQTVNVQLAGQACTIDVFQNAYGLFLNLYLAGVLVVGGVICQNLNRIVREPYRGFLGDLSFIDNEGSADPDYTGLGGRFSLAYLAAAELTEAA